MLPILVDTNKSKLHVMLLQVIILGHSFALETLTHELSLLPWDIEDLRNSAGSPSFSTSSWKCHVREVCVRVSLELRTAPTVLLTEINVLWESHEGNKGVAVSWYVSTAVIMCNFYDLLRSAMGHNFQVGLRKPLNFLRQFVSYVNSCTCLCQME